MSGWGDGRGERPRGDFVRWVPKVAPPLELRAGVVGPFGAANGPVGVGVIARVEAAIAPSNADSLMDCSRDYSQPQAQWQLARRGGLRAACGF